MSELQNIDDLLSGARNTLQPQTPEHQPEVEYGDPDEENNNDISEQPVADNESGEPGKESNQEEESEKEEQSHTDDYGNKKSTDNEVIRERLRKQAESMERRHHAEMEALRQQLTVNQSNQVKEASKDFEYDPDGQGDWQQQLKSFIKQTVSSMTQEEQIAQHRAREQQTQVHFETKFRQGMSNFEDFVEVVGTQPITDAMTVATRGMHDPASFLYAASKRAPEELARISKLPDPYAQIVEIGRLEERMRRTKQTTKAPRPVGRVNEDLTIPHKTDKKETIEDLIAKSDARRLAAQKARRR